MELPGQVDETAAWREIRRALHQALGESMFSVWIEPLQLAAIEGTTLLLQGPNDTTGWLLGRYGRVLERCARTVLGPDATVVFATAAGTAAVTSAAAKTGIPAGRTSRSRTGIPGHTEAEATLLDSATASLNPRYSFTQFIIGDGNRLAHAAALAVAEHPGQAYNPLFLHAPPGLGKTHLLHAIGNYVLAYGGGARVRYTTVEAFTNHFISALSSKTLERFKQTYRDVDVLLIDDVQFLASKAKTAEEFFHTFNALYENGRQLVFTADCLPSRLDGIADRLRERFGAGLVAEIEPPDLATRIAILRKRAALDRVPLEDDGVLELIAERVPDNIRALEGALIRVVAYHSLSGQPLDRELTRSVLDGMHYPEPANRPKAHAAGHREPPSIEAVKQAVAAHFGLSVEELVSASRAARVAWPRQLAIHLARELTGASLTAIGAAFGGRNHATVLHACKRVTDRASNDQQIAVDIDELSRELRRGLSSAAGSIEHDRTY